MPLSLRFRLNEHRTRLQGLKNAERILSRSVRTGMEAVGKRFQKSAASRMREDTGASRKSLQIVVTGRGLDLSLLVFSELIQALVDARGLHRGVFPPYRKGTRVYEWALRKAIGKQSVRVKTAGVPKRTLHQLNKNFERRRRLRQVPKVRVPRRARSGNLATRGRDAVVRRIAFMIARKIYRKGIAGTQWNRKALEANKSAMVREIQNSVLRAITEMKRA